MLQKPYKTQTTPIHCDKQPCIAIIDNDTVSTMLYQELLEQAGYRVLTADDGVSGLELLKGEAQMPVLIFVDCLMPNMDGETFLMRAHEEIPQIFEESKVVILTSFDQTSTTLKRIKKLGFDCREKPCGVNGIHEMISDFF